MNLQQNFDRFDYYIFINKFENDIRWLYSLLPYKSRKNVDMDKFMFFCYKCS